MSIVRIHRAECDQPGCDSRHDLDPSNPQPFLALIDAGWTVSAYDGPFTVICPAEHLHGTALVSADGEWVWLYNANTDSWFPALPSVWARQFDDADLAGKSNIKGFDSGVTMILREDGVQS